MNARARARIALPDTPGRAFSLIEVVLALGVVTFCTMTLIALIPVGLRANKFSREQVVALNLCRDIESDIKSTAATNATSPLYGVPIPATGAASTTILYDSYASSVVSFGTSPSPSSQYRFTVTLTGPSASFPDAPVNAHIQVTWPPGVVPIAPPAQSNPTNVVGTINLNVAINRLGS